MKTLTGRTTVALAALLLFTANSSSHDVHRSGYFGSGHDRRGPVHPPAVAPQRAHSLPLPPLPAQSQRGEKSA